MTSHHDIGFLTLNPSIYCLKFLTFFQLDVALYLHVYFNMSWFSFRQIKRLLKSGRRCFNNYEMISSLPVKLAVRRNWSQKKKNTSTSCLVGTKWATSWENLFMPYANNNGADQPAHPRSVISAFVVRCLDNIISSFYIRNLKPLSSFCSWAGRFESDSFTNSKDRFSRDVAQIIPRLGHLKYLYCKIPKNMDTRKNAVITLKFEQGGFTIH